MRKRYQIQIASLGDTLNGGPVKWGIFYSAREHWSLRLARREWWYWVQKEWDFTADRPLFRIWDTKKQEVVE